MGKSAVTKGDFWSLRGKGSFTMLTRFYLPPFSGNNGGGGRCRIRKAHSGRNPRWPRSLPVCNPWVHNGTGQWERDSQTGWITVSLSGCTLTFQAFVKATPFLTHMRTPPFSSTLLSPLKSLLYVLFMISGPFLFRVSVHNSAVYVIYDARNNLNHIRSLNIIGALESYIFLVMVKLRQW